MWYLIVFFISMVPIVEIRGAVPVAVANDLNLFWTYVICILGNMLPVPIIYLFARKVLVWGSDKKFIGRFFSFCLEKGEKGGGGKTVMKHGCNQSLDARRQHAEIRHGACPGRAEPQGNKTDQRHQTAKMQRKPVLPGLPMFSDDAAECFHQKRQQENPSQNLSHKQTALHPEPPASPQEPPCGQGHDAQGSPVRQAPTDKQGRHFSGHKKIHQREGGGSGHA